MSKTQHEVSAGKVALDLQAAKATAKLAASRLVRDIHEELQKLEHIGDGPTVELSAAKHIEIASEFLVIALETSRALEHAENRETIEIVNKERVTLYRTEHGMPLCPVCGSELRMTVSETYCKTPFNVELDESLDYRVAASTVAESIVEKIYCNSAWRHIRIDNFHDHKITWVTVKDQETLKERIHAEIA